MLVRRAGCTKCAGSVQYLAEETLESSWRCVPWRQRNSCSSPAWTGLSRWEIIGELIHHPTSYKILTAADREPRARPLPQGWHEGHKPRSSSVLSLKRTPRYSSRSTTPRRLWKLCLEGRDLTIRIAQAPTSTLADGRLGKTVVSGSTVVTSATTAGGTTGTVTTASAVSGAAVWSTAARS